MNISVNTLTFADLECFLQGVTVTMYIYDCIQGGPNTFDHKQKNGKKFFPNFFPIFEKTSTLQKLKFLKNLFFYFFEIQNLRTYRPIFSGPQSSASSLDLFVQGEQFSEIFEVF